MIKKGMNDINNKILKAKKVFVITILLKSQMIFCLNTSEVALEINFDGAPIVLPTKLNIPEI